MKTSLSAASTERACAQRAILTLPGPPHPNKNGEEKTTNKMTLFLPLFAIKSSLYFVLDSVNAKKKGIPAPS
jgi:hypothetical protein